MHLLYKFSFFSYYYFVLENCNIFRRIKLHLVAKKSSQTSLFGIRMRSNNLKINTGTPTNFTVIYPENCARIKII